MKRQPDHKVCISALKDPLSLSINNFEAQKSLSLLFTKQMMQWAMVRKKSSCSSNKKQLRTQNWDNKDILRTSFWHLMVSLDALVGPWSMVLTQPKYYKVPYTYQKVHSIIECIIQEYKDEEGQIRMN